MQSFQQRRHRGRVSLVGAESRDARGPSKDTSRSGGSYLCGDPPGAFMKGSAIGAAGRVVRRSVDGGYSRSRADLAYEL
jgi:hypothetical protein